MQDVGTIPQGHPGIELIDIIFVYSNVKLVRELVQDQIRQIEEMNSLSKGQAEGLRNMIMAKQKTLLTNLSDVEKTLEEIIDANATMGVRRGARNIQLNTEQSQAMIGAIVFAINHMAKFVPGPGPDTGDTGLPESMI
ncbi:MAG TPA: hypothetical protein VMC61_06680 [Methanocella sp.]|nr:hypothetical protein [Methanocella sp.]